ncbi:MAG: FAD-dependent oxidoreductase [Cytophagales bacterium]|nr:FAD-dependent oxidoreductase [Cytophagales bacterium]
MRSIAVVGAGLAGAACAHAFAHAGYSVTVYEQAATPAAGASGVPVGLFAPSTSSDDAPHSRLLRSGVNLLLLQLRRLSAAGLLVEGQDWAMTGVLERCLRGDKNLPSTWLEPQDPLGLQSTVAGEPFAQRPAGKVQEIFHGAAGWVLPARLIAAWLAHPRINRQTQVRVSDAAALDADAVVVACGYQTPQLIPALQGALQPIRGQVEWGGESAPFDKLRANGGWLGVSEGGFGANGVSCPVNGMGHFIATPDAWLAGATYQRDETAMHIRAKDRDKNFEKLAALMPEWTAQDVALLRSHSQSWVGVRTAQKNRKPLVVQPEPIGQPRLWVCTGLGSRGLSLAALCAADLLAAVQRGCALG